MAALSGKSAGPWQATKGEGAAPRRWLRAVASGCVSTAALIAAAGPARAFGVDQVKSVFPDAYSAFGV
jgi:hypothetical protein